MGRSDNDGSGAAEANHGQARVDMTYIDDILGVEDERPGNACTHHAAGVSVAPLLHAVPVKGRTAWGKL